SVEQPTDASTRALLGHSGLALILHYYFIDKPRERPTPPASSRDSGQGTRISRRRMFDPSGSERNARRRSSSPFLSAKAATGVLQSPSTAPMTPRSAIVRRAVSSCCIVSSNSESSASSRRSSIARVPCPTAGKQISGDNTSETARSEEHTSELQS